MRKKSARPPPRRPRSFEIEELEARRLLAADPLIGGLLGADFALDDPNTTGGTVQIVAPPAPLAPTTGAQTADENRAAKLTDEALSQSREIVFIDVSIADADVLLLDLQAQQANGRPLDIVQIQADDDGIAVITAHLARGDGEISAVHILSHGDAAGLQLGQVRLDQAALGDRLSDISAWSHHLSANADLLLYGCNLADSAEGRELIEQLALLSGADVGASDDLTGSALLHGDWELEYQVGQVETQAAITYEAQAQWQQVLATITFQEGVSSYTGTLDTYLDKATPTTSRATSTTLKVDDGTPNDMQTLIRFDNIIGASYIPLGSTVSSASLTVYVTNHDSGDSVMIHKMLSTWSESSTYNSMVNGVATNNTEASSSSLDTLDAGISGAATLTGLASSVQAWASGGTNYGWVLVTGDSNADDWTIVSSEGATSSQRPKLSVTYTAPTPPAVDLDGSVAGVTYSNTFTEGGAAARIADTDASVTAGVNTISTSLSSMTVRITNLLDGTAESLSATTGGTSISASYDSATGILSLTGTDTAANYQTVLRSVTYSNSSDNPTTTARSITVVAADPYGGNSATATCTMAITAVNDAPVITSNGGGASASTSVAETLTAVTTVTASDVDGSSFTYSISGGADAAKFSIVGATGVLTFASAPDFESPTDSGGNNVYDVIVRVTDGGGATDTQSIAVTVTDVVSTLVVTTTTDNNDTGLGTSFTAEQLNATKGTDGLVSLREAIIASNTTSGTDTITFNLTSGAGAYGEYTITTASALPNLTGTVYINGASQSGYVNRPLIVLDGNGGSGDGLYLSSTADGSTIRGLLIRDFSTNGIYVQAGSDNNIIVGNYIGSFNGDGSNAGVGESNLSEGIESYGANLTVGGTTAADRNVISGNGSAYNIYLATGSNGTTIQGNYIGTDAAGTAVFATTNSSYGIMVESPATNITIGGTASGSGNVISGFTNRGIWVTTSGTTTVQGNYIGTDYTGTVDLGNTGYGLYIDDTGSVTIGGTSANAGNLISGNNGGGVYASSTGSVTMQGNIIGLNASGTAALGNTGVGLYLSTTAASTIGGNGSSSRNIISGNSSHGIDVRSSPAAGHVIKGNYIGVAADGSTLLGNGGAGIYIASSNTVVGGKTSGDGNIIAGNVGAGIAVASGNGNLFYQNSIHSNTGLGIDLGNDSVTANDYNDADAGGNYQNNFPVITSVVTNGTSTRITGSIDWRADAQPVYIEFFSNPSADASGHGEGRTYLGYAQVTTDAATGDATFTTTLTGISAGDWITAVANFEGGNIGASEYALAVQSVAPSAAPRGRALWNTNDRFYQQYVEWSSAGFSGIGTNGLSFGDDIGMITAVESPTRNEILFIGSADASGKILAGIWNGSAWSSVISIPIASPSATASNYNSFAVAYDELSGNAMLIWDNGNTGTTGLSYAIWDGSGWSATNTITAPVSGEPVHMKLAASPTTNEMVLVVETTAASNNQYAIVWDGSSWGNSQTLDSNSSKQYYEINVAYEQQSGQAMVIYDASASNSSAVQYRTWNGSTWSAEDSIAVPGGITAASELYSTVIASDPGSDRIAMAAKNAANEVWLAVWDGSSWGSTQAATTSGVALTDSHPTMALAFESQSGDLLAAYGKAAGPNIYYRTWDSGTGWSAEGTGPSVGGTDIPYIIKLYSDPYSNTIMMGAQDNASDLSMAVWDGSAWGSVSTLDSATGFTYRENFTYVWYRDAAVISNLDGNTLNYSEGDAATVIDQGDNAEVVLDANGGYFTGGNLAVSFTSGSTTAEDVLGIRNQGSGGGQIGVSGANVTYGGTVIGTYSGGTSGNNLVITLNSSASDAAITALVRNITYQNTNTQAPSTTDRNVRFVITNAMGHASAHNNVTVSVTGVNDAPTNTVPGAQATNEDTSLTFSSGNGNLISIADVDAGSASMQVTLGVSHGSITLSGTAGLSFSVGDGTSDATMTFTGTVSAINAALAGLVYTPTSNYAGADSLSIVTSDQGNSGSGGALSDSDSVAITVNAVNDAPVISSNGGGASASVNVAENATAVTTVAATDVENASLTYSISGGADAGKFSIDASTGALTFNSAPDYESPTDTGANNVYDVIVTVSDGTLTDTQSIAVTVTPVADIAPVITSNGGGASASINVAENSTTVTTVTATDADLPGDTLTYSISGGADAALFAIDGSTGVLTFVSGRNREAATDANSDHVYVVTVRSSDGTNTDTQTISVTITDVDEFNVGAVTDGNGAANTIAENTTNGTAVGITASASDADATTNTITYSLSDNAGGRFTIDGSTGVVTVADSTLLNYEAATSHSITVLATSADASTSSQSFTINLTDVDEFNVGAVTDGNGGANSVAENASNGTTVGVTASASDADGSTNTITYSLTDSAGGRFTIDGSTGIVTVNNSTLLNYESATSHSITVLATSADGSTSSASFTINLTDVDEFNVGAVTDANGAANSVTENAANGSTVGVTASASDADATTNTITYSLTDNAGGRFTIDGSTGIVTVLDGSLLNYEGATSHSITVLATSADGSTSSQSFTVNLSDVDEFNVGAVTDVNGAANSVAENAANGAVVGLTASASDADGSNNTITYSLTDDAGGRFTIDGSTGVVTVADASLLDYETNTSHDITVQAASSDGSTSTQAFTINIIDSNDAGVGAISDSDAAANLVNENVANGTAVGLTALAIDPDVLDTVSYSLTDDAGGRFTIDGVTGVVTVLDGSLLNREAAASHQITVLATSSDTSTSSRSFTIQIGDVDEFNVGAVTDSNGTANSVAENATNGTSVGITATASDADSTTNTITYSLSDSAGGRFAIDASTGVVTVADGTLLNYESATSHSVTVVATSADTSSSNQTFTINLSDVDEFDVGAVTDGNGAANSVAENATNGTTVGVTASATDADATTNTITYTLSDSAGGRFTIDGSTGIVTVLDGSLLNYEAATSHNITVLATSADGSTSTETFTINLTDVDEFNVGAVSDSNAGANTVAEDAVNGAAVGITASASDADATTNTITYSLTDSAGGIFAIDGGTGVVTVADDSLLNYEGATSHNITVRATSADGSTSDQVFTINVTDVDEFDAGAVTDSNVGANTVSEGAANGATVGVTASASDADGSTNTITYSLTDSAGGRFTIDSGTGIVTVADNTLLNYEGATSHNITVLATSADGSTSTETFTINVSDVDEFNVGAVSDIDAGANTVVENAGNGTAVGITASASDADGSNNAITYTLTDNAGGRFTIDGGTGIVTVADGSLLNYEAATSHNITVRATSADGSTSDSSFTISLSDADEFNVGAVTDVNAGANSVAENSTNGATVGITANATDADGTTNTITYSLTDSAGGRFTIHGSTGVVTVADGTLLNYEAATSHNITVRTTSADGSTSDQGFTVNLTDVNEFAVSAVSDANAGANSLSENAANGTAVGITGSASDADGTTNTITYALTDSAGGRFTIHASTGVVTVADGSRLNYESAASHSVTVRATSADGSSSSQSFIISLTDVDEFDVSPVSDVNAGGNTVAENATNGSTVGITANATDADGTTNTVTYALTDSAGGRFTIHASTGVVTVADGSLLNYEAATSHNISVRATSADGSTSDLTFTINVSDVDEFDVGAVSDVDATASTIAENTVNGTTVGITASASDADGSNNTVTYSLTDSADGRFTIDSGTGVVTVADSSLLNYESATSHTITVLATSADGSTSDHIFTINLTDLDEFDVGAVSDSNATANTVAENAVNGTTVGLTASAVDADGTTNTITYSLTDDAGGRFTIDGGTGVVTVANGSLLNYEAATSHDITVLATSADGSTSSANFTINLGDVDEFDVGAVSDSNAAANTVAENVVNGTAVGITASATDADGSLNTITYSLSDDAGGRFTIDGSTGIVTVADGSLLNFEAATSHSITVLATSADGSTSSAGFTINLSDVDEFDVGAVADTNADANSVIEGAANGTAAGLTASASDADGSTNAITYTLANDAGGRFAIHATTGVVTVANGSLLDREAASSHDITVRATSADGSTSDQIFTINLTDLDEFDVGAVADINAAVNTIAENTANGTAVGITANATDADSTTNTITYSLTDDAGGRFAVDASTGVVTVADGSLLNHEAATSHNITVRATSADGSTSEQGFTVNLTDVDEFDVSVVSDSDAAANTIAENTANGTAVGITAIATDADSTTNTVTYALTDSAGGRFAIDATTGVVTVADGSLLNHEATTSHNITVRATSADGSTSDQSFTINLTDVDEFDVSTVSDSNAAANTIAENTANGTAVGITANATDADSTNNTITYSLTDSAGGRFTIDASTGVVTVADGTLLNHEAATSHNITVLATSTDGSTSSDTFTINLSDVDEFDVGAVTDTSGSANAVAENAANGTTVGITANATDADSTTNTVTYALTDSAGGRFTIDASTGIVTVADGSLLDREAASTHNITVRATSADGSISSANFTINLSDIDEFDVSAVTDTNGAANAVNENAANGSTVGITANATDADSTTNTVTYALSDSAGGRFAIDTSTGIVTVADGSLLDREAAASHNITVQATSADGSISSTTLTINLGDVDEFDVAAITDNNGASNTVAENAATGTVAGITANATDADSTTNTVTYTLTDNAGGRFAIDGSTGVITVADGALLDHEAATSHNITVVATSTDGSTSNQSFTINLSDVDEFDVGAVSDTDGAANTVAENAANGTTVGITSRATDADSTTNTVTYTLSDDAGGRFAIGTSTGVITVADGSLLDRETAASHSITVLATSVDGSTSSASFTINLGDVDEFDVGPVTDTDSAANTVAENAANGATVGITANATDADGTTNTVTYTLTDNAGGRFTIDTSSGVITVADGSLLDVEAAASHNITVLATSADGSTSSQTFTINLGDVDEFDVGAIGDTDAAADTVAENAATGTIVGITASAMDADGSTNTIAYSLTDNASGRFSIDAATGIVTVADGSLLDSEAGITHDITVQALSADGSISSRTYTITLQGVNDNTPDWAMAQSTFQLPERTNAVITLTATDADIPASTLSYSIVGGSDAAQFALDSSTGALSMLSLPNYLAPSDANGDNRYEVVVQVSDGTFSRTMTLYAEVTDQPEPYMPPPAPPSTNDGRGAANEETETSPPESTDPEPEPELETKPTAEPIPSRDTANQDAPSADLLLGASPTGAGGGIATRASDDASLRSNALARFQLGYTANDMRANWTLADTSIQILNDMNEVLNARNAMGIPASGLTTPSSLTFAKSNDDDGGDGALLTSVPEAMKAGGLAMTLGTIWWASRASGLIASMMISAPAWRSFDPLPVLFNRPDDEAASGGDTPSGDEAMAEQMFDNRTRNVYEATTIG